MSSIRKIAKEAGVSVATVSRYLDPEKKLLVKPETRKQIEKVIRRHHYIPNRAARALSKKTSDTIGIVTPFHTDVVKSPYFTRIIAGIIEGIEPLKYDLKWIMIRDDIRKTCTLESILKSYMVDGLIFLTWRHFPKLVQGAESKRNLPIVMINDYDKRVRASMVYSDNSSGTQQMLDYLDSKKFKRIGIVRGPDKISPDARFRLHTVKKWREKNPGRIQESDIFECPRFSREMAYSTIKKSIKKKNHPDALFCFNDQIAFGAVDALREMGLTVPEDIAVVGYDGVVSLGGSEIKLTTMSQPLEEMGRHAVEILNRLLTRQMKSSTQMCFEPKLVTGDSG